jgi:FkbM family methyltransferase
MSVVGLVASLGNALPAGIGLPLRARVGPRLEPELALLARLVPAGSLAVDVGANRGVYTYHLSRAVGPDGEVIAYEPQPELAAYVRTGTARAGNVTVRAVALGESPGSARLTIPLREGRPEPGWATLRSEPNDPGLGYDVPVVTLDDELAGREISFIKIDVEGYELATLRGALATLRRSRPVVLAEIEHAWSGASVAPTLELLAGLGYGAWAIDTRKPGRPLERVEWSSFEPPDAINDVVAGQRTSNFLFQPL